MREKELYILVNSANYSDRVDQLNRMFEALLTDGGCGIEVKRHAGKVSTHNLNTVFHISCMCVRKKHIQLIAILYGVVYAYADKSTLHSKGIYP